MEYPWKCNSCQFLNMVAMESINRNGAVGYDCEKCGKFQAIRVTNRSIESALEKLGRTSPTHSKFRFFFQRALHKAMSLQDR